MFVFYLIIITIHLSLCEDYLSPIIYSDCTHLILPLLCQCYHLGNESQLDCHHIGLESLPKLPNNMRWNALDFSLNNLTSIGSYGFSDIYVEKLDFKLNSIRRIDETAFEQIQNLKHLFLNYNQLKEFNPQILTSLTASLEIFDISFNPLGYVDLGEIFLQLPFLKQFHAVSCQLNQLSLYTLSKLTNHSHYAIELIDLSYNKLTSLCNNLFTGFYRLTELRLNNNNIYAIDNNFIHSLEYLKILNLAFNSIEYVPSIHSPSIEILNFSSNHIRHLNDYFASNLRSIRLIDFDSNKYLQTISERSLCFINILTIEKLIFRSNNISSLNQFSELLCRLSDENISKKFLDLNNNIYLKCDCTLIQFENYLIDYLGLTCAQQGQDRYFISKLTNMSSNCTSNYCFEEKKKSLCIWANTEHLSAEGTCQIPIENLTKNQSELIELTTTLTFLENFTENATQFKSLAISFQRLDSLYFLLVYLTFHRFF